MTSLLLYQFINEHPAEVAAQLEGKPVSTVKAFIEELPNNEFANLIPHLSSKYINAVTENINDEMIEILCRTQPPYIMLRIYHTLTMEEQEYFISKLPHRFKWYIKYLKSQTRNAISTMISYNFLSLHEDTQVADAIKAIKQSKQKIPVLYTHDDKNKITGDIDILELHHSNTNLSLVDCAKPIRHAQAPTANIEDVLKLRAWNRRTILPIIDHDKHLIGVVSINTLFEELMREENETRFSIYDGAEQVTRAVYSVFESIASVYRKQD